ncbi:MAG: DUF2461 domain-containing protein [Cytophagales bacterium]|nr:DUF2461 domain-containing protein [Cytophagales bacterium]
MQYFGLDFIEFFQELEENNHKEWFHEHKKRYEKSVKEPILDFLLVLIAKMQEHDNTIRISPKDCLSRINRDVRFAKDKSPYNRHHTAFISPKGRKDKSYPGLYIRFSPEKVAIMSGCYQPSKEQLASIRHNIQHNLDTFHEIITKNDFVEKFGDIKGERLRRIPKDLKNIAETQPLITNKSFYVYAEFSPDLLFDEEFLDIALDHFITVKPFNQFLIDSFPQP